MATILLNQFLFYGKVHLLSSSTDQNYVLRCAQLWLWKELLIGRRSTLVMEGKQKCISTESFFCFFLEPSCVTYKLKQQAQSKVNASPKALFTEPKLPTTQTTSGPGLTEHTLKDRIYAGVGKGVRIMSPQITPLSFPWC